MNQLQAQLEQIQPLHQPSMDMAVRRWNSIAKPLNSLGLLENLSYKLQVSREIIILIFQNAALSFFVADNGVVAEGISQVAVKLPHWSLKVLLPLKPV